jgi:hypothetical protein
MRAFDNLPVEVRRAMAGARFRFASEPIVRRIGTRRDTSSIVFWIESGDDLLALRAYVERGFSRDEATALVKFDQGRRNGNA